MDTLTSPAEAAAPSAPALPARSGLDVAGLSLSVVIPAYNEEGALRIAGRGAPRASEAADELATIRGLADAGADFGNHTANHPDLSRVPLRTALDELDRADARFLRELGARPAHAAPPYGRSTAELRAELTGRFATAVGTRLDSASADSTLHDLPRLEMYYFTDLRRWKAHLAGRGEPCLAVRRTARRVRRLLRGA